MKTPREKYQNDNAYRLLVDTMVAQIIDAKFTPSEMREASLLASIMYAEMNVNPQCVMLEEMEQALNVVHKWADRAGQP